MSAVTATEPGAEAGPPPTGPRPPAARRRPPAVVPLVVALLVLMLAEGAVRAARSRLDEPEVWPTPELQKKFAQIEARRRDGRRPDVLLAGDSMMDAGGDPAGLARAVPGATVYNAAIAGETLPVIADWTTRIVQPRLDPKVVVIGFSSNELNPSSLAPESGVAAYRSSRVVRVAEGRGSPVDRADALLREHVMLYRYRATLRRPFRQAAADPDVFDPELSADGQGLAFTELGYLEKGGAAQAEAVIQGVIAALRGFTVGLENLTILQDMIRTIRIEGARVVLVAMPVTADLVAAHPKGDADYREAMEAFAGAAHRAGATLLEPGVWPTSLFADPVHLNGAGAARLTEYLAPFLQQEVDAARRTGP